MSAAAATISIAVAAGLFWLAYKYSWLFDEEARFSAELKTRHRLPDDLMIAEYFRDGNIDPTIPIRLRQIFGRQFQLNHERIRPDDDFGRIYADLDFFLVVEEIENEFGISLSDDECIVAKGTIRGVAKLVLGKLNATLESHRSS